MKAPLKSVTATLAGIAGALLLSSCENTGSSIDRPQLRMAGGETFDELNISLTGCNKGPASGLPLKPHNRIEPQGGVLDTELVVRIKKRCVPAYNSSDKKWEWQEMNLRTYGVKLQAGQAIDPSDENDPNIGWSAPGPTFVLYTSDEGKNNGTRFQMTLHNRMPVQPDYDQCDTLLKGGEPVSNPHYEFPNCFHGNNVTNFHFHGFHISPRPHQDDVLVSIYPAGSELSAASGPSHGGGENLIGSNIYNVPPIPHNQAPGTHWYHAHKHGATALQVLNGLVGTFDVRGEFDEKLQSFYNNQLEEKFLVVQQLAENLSGIGGTSKVPVLVNGQAEPVIEMRPGEIQRWRFVGATMQASASLVIGFDEGVNGANADMELKQIAMDGVQFAPENYHCQTWINGPCNNDDTPNINTSQLNDFKLHPGNRIDILIKAPETPGEHLMFYQVNPDLGPDLESQFVQLVESLSESNDLADSSKTALLKVRVIDDIAQNMPFPRQDEFPEMPAFLADIPTTASDPKEVLDYQMEAQKDSSQVHFSINKKAYCPDCVDLSFVLKQPKQIRLTNNSAIAHPFHIHTNPFQLRSMTKNDAKGNIVIGSDGKPEMIEYKPPYLWMDTLAIPTAVGDESRNPPLPVSPLGEANIVYRAENFTGAFVNHCHILGHEDRGMMQNVIATCPDGRWTANPNGTCNEPTIAVPLPMCSEGEFCGMTP